MGYDIHTTRRTNWFDDGGPVIALHEWTALVAFDLQMRLDGYAEARLPDGGVFRAEDPSLAVWLAYSGDGVDGSMAWVWHSGGNVMAKNPDAEIRAEMWRLARALGARAQGDESEFHGPDGEALVERSARPASAQALVAHLVGRRPADALQPNRPCRNHPVWSTSGACRKR